LRGKVRRRHTGIAKLCFLQNAGRGNPCQRGEWSGGALIGSARPAA